MRLEGLTFRVPLVLHFPSMYSPIAELVDRYPAESKVLFVPQYQFGLAIEDTLARKKEGWAALTCMTPIQYANRVTKYHLTGQAMPTGAEGLLAAQAIDQLLAPAREALLLPGQVTVQAGTAQSLARLFDVLRREDITPSAYRQIVEATEGPQAKRHAAEASAFTTYTQLLETNSYVDGALTLKEAIRVIEEDVWTVSAEVFAVLGELPLTRLETRLLEAIQARAKAFYLVPGALTAESAVDGGAAGKGVRGGGAPCASEGKPAGERKYEENRPVSSGGESVTYPEGTAGHQIDAPALSGRDKTGGRGRW